MTAGDRTGSSELDVAAELPLLAELLADRSTWIEPDAGLEDAVMAAVADAEPSADSTATLGRPGATGRRRTGGLVAVAAAVIAVAVGTITATRGGTSGDFEVTLSATALAPAARGSVEVTHSEYSFRLTLDAKGLPAAPPGTF